MTSSRERMLREEKSILLLRVAEIEKILLLTPEITVKVVKMHGTNRVSFTVVISEYSTYWSLPTISAQFLIKTLKLGSEFVKLEPEGHEFYDFLRD